MRVSSFSELQALRYRTGAPSVLLTMNSFLAGNLPAYAMRYALWSCALDGRVVIDAPSTLDSVTFTPSQWSFQMLTQVLCKAAEGLGELVVCDVSSRRLEFSRTAAPMVKAPWSAIVMFSGSDSERPHLEKSIEALIAQPELAEGGEIIVCGPELGRGAVCGMRGVRYASLETPEKAGRFLVGKKKNLAIAQARNERVLVCHTRITLRPGCLAALPEEFDLITPRVWVRGAKSDLAYLDLGFFHGSSIAIHSWRPQPPVHYDRSYWLQKLKCAYPYIDGGLFCVRRSMAQSIPMSESIAWGEAEDAEWALRWLHCGRLLEIGLHAHAESATCKTPRYARWGHLRTYRVLSTAAQYVRSATNIFAKWSLMRSLRAA